VSEVNRNGQLRYRQRLGKYRIEKKLGNGGFATVYSATDTIEGVRVAIKVPHAHYVSDEMMDLFRQEVRLVARLDHPNVLGVKDASIIDGRFVIVSLIGNETLDERLKRRISVAKAYELGEQMLDAAAYAHEHGIVHCDIKPDNFIMFDDDHVRLTDFGIAKVSRYTIEGSGTGTVGFMAPEQAMGRPSARSDVFSLGLILYRMLSGKWPVYPFAWPPPGAANLRSKRVHPDMIKILKKAMSPTPRMRYTNASRMSDAWHLVLPRALRLLKRKRKR
jgi:serine/threonine-protein kinase